MSVIMSQRCPFLYLTKGPKGGDSHRGRQRRQPNHIPIQIYTGRRFALYSLYFDWVCRQWLDLTARVLMGSCVQSGGWDHPVYTQYIVYYIPRSRHGAASHISQTSGFLHLLTSGQQPDTSSTPSAFTGVPNVGGGG